MYDMKNLVKLKTLEANAPDGWKAGAVSVKYKELIALGVAFTTQCPYCIEIHAGRAREAGATDQEISETVIVAALRAGGAMTHGTHALK
jgi:AhpD family alkylhydroperoxidase